MRTDVCAFETKRLLVKIWHSFSPGEWPQQDLVWLVVDVLTEAVTRTLPEPWQGRYTPERARRWMEERDREGSTLLVVDKATRQAVGLLILLKTVSPDESEGAEIRLGYLLSSPNWGKGYASELVHGLVGWARKQPGLSSLAGGVGHDNVASRRVLEKNGFQPVRSDGAAAGGEQVFRLRL